MRPLLFRVVNVKTSEELEAEFADMVNRLGHVEVSRPKKVVYDEEWKELWRQPCPVCDPHTLLDHASGVDVNELLSFMNQIQDAEIPQVRSGPMQCVKCECFISRVALFLMVIAKANRRKSFREPFSLAMPDDLFGTVVGFDDIKEVLRRSLTSLRPVHQLLHGPPASAKTLFMQEMLARGILTLGTHNMSYAHSDADIEKTLAAYDEVFPLLKEAVDGGRLDKMLRCAPLKPLFKVR